MNGESRAVVLGCDSCISHDAICKFLEYFGELCECIVYDSDKEDKYKYSVDIKYVYAESCCRLLAWPHPLLIDGAQMYILEQEPELYAFDSTLTTLGTTDTINAEPSSVPLTGICLKVSRIPKDWEAFNLYISIGERFPDAVETTMVSEFEDDWGLKQGLIELKVDKIAEQLVQEGESVYSGHVLDFTYCDLPSIYPLNRETMASYTVFPWQPSAPLGQLQALQWDELFSPPLPDMEGVIDEVVAETC